MKRSHPAFWAAGWAGTAVGILLVAFGTVGSDDVASLAAGYGAILTASAVYLLGGLKLRDLISRRSHAAAASSVSAAIGRTAAD